MYPENSIRKQEDGFSHGLSLFNKGRFVLEEEAGLSPTHPECHFLSPLNSTPTPFFSLYVSERVFLILSLRVCVCVILCVCVYLSVCVYVCVSVCVSVECIASVCA